jgi:molybdate transport system ATP-binding protein
MLAVEDLNKTYGKLVVLDRVSFRIEAEILVVLGLNASGKSTLLKVISGIQAPDSGRVLVAGEDITDLDPENRRIGYVPQHPALFDHLNVRDNIRYAYRNGRGNDTTTQSLTEMLDLQELLERRPGTLSGGYQSRVSLARAMASEPRVMLLDEPLSDLDVAIKQRLIPKFKTALQTLGIPVVYVTHDKLEAELLGDSFLAMVDGKITDVASATEAFGMIQESIENAAYSGS